MKMPDRVDRIFDEPSGVEGLLLVFLCAPFVLGGVSLARSSSFGSPLWATGGICSILGVLLILVVIVQVTRASARDRREIAGEPGRWLADEESWERARRRHDSLAALHVEHELDPGAAFARLGLDSLVTRRLHTALVVADDLRTDTAPDISKRRTYIRAVAELDSAWAAASQHA